MTERILVFKGDKVTYWSLERYILCESKDDCFFIQDVFPDDVVGIKTVEIFYPFRGFIIEGKELWSDGEKWIIKG